MIEFIKNGGYFMYPIMFILAIGTAIIIERFIYLSRIWIDGEDFWKKIEPHVRSYKFEEAIKLCKAHRAVLPKILQSGLEEASRISHIEDKKDRRELLENYIEETMLSVMPRIERRTHYLPTLANVATLLGLLGTIIGLIQSFQSIAIADPSQKATILARGISVAMNTTAFGLIVAIPIMLCYAYIQSKTIKIIDMLDAFSIKLINILTSD